MENVRVKDRDFRLLLTRETIQERIADVAERINRELDGKDPLFLGVLNGAFMFASDLMKRITIPCEISFIKFASYQGMQQGSDVREIFGLSESIEGRTVVIVEDIVDSGRTLLKLIETLRTKHPREVYTTAFLLKPEALICDIALNYVAFEIPTDFVVGYGMDYDGYGRTLDQVYAVID